MKALPCIAALSLLGLSACQTTTEKSAAAAPRPSHAPAAMYQPRVEDDLEYIAYVERVARRRGLILQWVNKPQKRIVENP